MGVDVEHEFSSENVVVTYDDEVCIHAGDCVKHLPAVFDVNRDPWIDPTAAPADDIEVAVNACPSGALGLRRSGPQTPQLDV